MWLGVLLAIEVSVGGWVITNVRALDLVVLFVTSLFLLLVGLAAFKMHKRILRKIDLLERM
jgi:hypothetical protein